MCSPLAGTCMEIFYARKYLNIPVVIISNDPKFEKFGKLIRKGYITGNRLITEKDLHKKDYTLFLSALGLSASGGCCGV